MYTSFVNDLVHVLAKSVAVGKTPRQTLLFDHCCTGRILHWHSAIIMKSSPHYVSPPFPVCDVVLVPGLLPIFLHSCEIKSGNGLGMKLCKPCSRMKWHLKLIKTVYVGTDCEHLSHHARILHDQQLHGRPHKPQNCQIGGWALARGWTQDNAVHAKKGGVMLSPGVLFMQCYC